MKNNSHFTGALIAEKEIAQKEAEGLRTTNAEIYRQLQAQIEKIESMEEEKRNIDKALASLKRKKEKIEEACREAGLLMKKWKGWTRIGATQENERLHSFGQIRSCFGILTMRAVKYLLEQEGKELEFNIRGTCTSFSRY